MTPILVCALIAVAARPSVPCLQDSEPPSLQEEKRRELAGLETGPSPESQDFTWDWGGWLSAQYLSIDDPPEEGARQQRYWDGRIWASAVLENRYRLFVRIRNTFQDYNSGDQFGKSERETKALRLDQGYLEASWPEWAEGAFGPGADIHVRAGRQFLSVGTGLLLNGVYDGLAVDGRIGTWEWRLFGAHTIVSEDDIDRSLPDADDSHRLFVGTQVTWTGLGKHRPYAALLVERDLNDADDPVQEFAYDAWYLALGTRGNVLLPGLGYHAEFCWEGGSSGAAGTQETESIRAWALQLGAEWYAPWATSPRLFADLMWASGDDDRGNPTDTTSGNRVGTDDEGFLAFGYVETGYALSPRLSNLRILRVGASFRPLENSGTFRALEIGLAFYHYTKDESSESITDPRSLLDDEEVGTEVDLFVRWRVFSDLGVSFTFGRFMPGGAYQVDDDREFIAAGVTYSF